MSYYYTLVFKVDSYYVQFPYLLKVIQHVQSMTKQNQDILRSKSKNLLNIPIHKIDFQERSYYVNLHLGHAIFPCYVT